MRGEYKLLRQAGGKGAFAHVIVDREQTLGQPTETFIIFEKMKDDLGETVKLPSNFAKSAQHGCAAALKAVRLLGYNTTNQIIKIVSVRINIVDTTADAVESAAFLATADSFNTLEKFELNYRDGWVVNTRSNYKLP
jgi:hypothetical protein